MKIFIDSADIDEIKKVKSYGLLAGVTTNPSLIKKAAKKHKVRNLEEYIRKILITCKGIPVSLEVIGNTERDMLREGLLLYKKFNKVAKNVVIKIPVNPSMKKGDKKDDQGIHVIKALNKRNIPVNVTLVFTPHQAITAAIAGATYVSPFVGREDDYLRDISNTKFDKKDYFPKKGKKIDDNGIVSGVNLIEKIYELFNLTNSNTKILAASIRNARQIVEVSEAGAHIATIPKEVIDRIYKNKKLLNKIKKPKKISAYSPDIIAHPKTMEGMINFKKDTIPEYAKIFRK